MKPVVVHTWLFEQICMMFARILPDVSVTYASCQSLAMVSEVRGQKYQKRIPPLGGMVKVW